MIARNGIMPFPELLEGYLWLDLLRSKLNSVCAVEALLKTVVETGNEYSDVFEEVANDRRRMSEKAKQLAALQNAEGDGQLTSEQMGELATLIGEAIPSCEARLNALDTAMKSLAEEYKSLRVVQDAAKADFQKYAKAYADAIDSSVAEVLKNAFSYSKSK